MIRNYILIVWRNIKRNKVYSFINISGLSIGMAIFILITLYARFELNFEKLHPNFKNICRAELNLDGKGRLVGLVHNGMGPALVAGYPEIKSSTRLNNFGGQQSLSVDDDNDFPGQRGLMVESSFFEVFGFRLLQGAPASVLSEPFTIVLSEDLAQKMFPNENPVGKTLRLNRDTEYRVTGVIENGPPDTHIQFNFLASYITQNNLYGEGYIDSWERISCYTYIVLEDNTDLVALNEKLKTLLTDRLGEEYPAVLYLKPLADIHFHSNVLGEFGPGGDLNQVRISLAIGFFVLLIACINFMNLATARSTRRSKEVGLRKVVGASRALLIRQYLSESLFFAFLALLLAIILSELLLKPFNEIVGRDLDLDFMRNWQLSLQMLLVALAVGLFSGSYPAFFLSSLKPIQVLKEGHYPGSGNVVVRKALVVFQFAISIFLIFGTLMIQRQMQFIRNKNLGFEKEQILVTALPSLEPEVLRKSIILQNDLLQEPDIVNVSFSRFVPTFNGAATVFRGWEGSTEGEEAYVNINWIDDRFLETYQIPLLAGRNFFENSGLAEAENCLINEAAAQRLGWDDPVGKRLGEEFTIIGLVKDYHFASLRYQIEPLILYHSTRPGQNPRIGHQVSIKLSGHNLDRTVEIIEQKFKEIYPAAPFRYQFLDEQFQRMYTAEQRTSKTVGYLSLIAIFIACLGLFGLASHTAEQHTREIGIRKVLGGSVAHIVYIFTREFAKWILLANLLAWPIAWLAMHKWLENFAYRTSIPFWFFLLAGVMALTIALITVSFQSIRSALANPVKALRYE